MRKQLGNRSPIDRLAGLAVALFALVGLAGVQPATAENVHYGFPKIRHVIMVVQENRSFDDLFQGFPGADTQSYGYTSKGKQVALKPITLETAFYINHYAQDFHAAYDGGRNDRFDREKVTCNGYEKCHGLVLPQYSYVPASETQPYTSIASQYVLADRMFGSTYDGEFESHLQMISAQDGRTLGNPDTRPWGCDNENGATYVDRLPPLGPVFPCFNFPTLPDEMDPAGVTWRMYFDSYEVLNGFEAIQHIRYGPDWSNVVSPPSQFLTDVASGSLSDVTWITPSLEDSDLGGRAGGPDWVASIVNAVGESKFWDSTAIFVTWSTWGGFYDHVAPPQDAPQGRSFRVPLLIVSPYVPAGRVTHQQYQHGSILKFAEEAFGLNPLTELDRRAYSPAQEFDFSRPARKFVPIAP
jgi:phospholipase C